MYESLCIDFPSQVVEYGTVGSRAANFLLKEMGVAEGYLRYVVVAFASLDVTHCDGMGGRIGGWRVLDSR